MVKHNHDRKCANLRPKELTGPLIRACEGSCSVFMVVCRVFVVVTYAYRHSLVNPINPLEMDVEEIFFTNSNVEGVVMTKVYTNKVMKSVTSMRDFVATDLEKLPRVASIVQ